MTPDETVNPHLQSGYAGDEDEARVLKNGPEIRTQGLKAAENRGKRAPPEGSGVVIGSGAAAGGGGDAEDFDSDPQGGGGAVRTKHEERRPTQGADAPVSGSR